MRSSRIRALGVALGVALVVGAIAFDTQFSPHPDLSLGLILVAIAALVAAGLLLAR